MAGLQFLAIGSRLQTSDIQYRVIGLTQNGVRTSRVLRLALCPLPLRGALTCACDDSCHATGVRIMVRWVGCVYPVVSVPLFRSRVCGSLHVYVSGILAPVALLNPIPFCFAS